MAFVLRRIVPRQIGTDDLILFRSIRQAKDTVAREIKHAGLVPAADERRVPVKTVTLLAFRRFRPQVAHFTGAQIDPMNEAFLAFGVKNIAIGRIEHDIKSIAALERDPIGITNPFFARHLARADKILVVLQSAGDSVKRLRVVERDAVKFARRKAD